MASIVKRKNKYAVVYSIEKKNGSKRQKWETFSTHAEAKKRKSQIEYQQNIGTFIAPTSKTIRELLEEYVSIYGVNAWALSTYESRISIIDNYINPIIGNMKLDDITPKIMDKYYKDLLAIKAKLRPHHKKNSCISTRRVREIHKILHNAFNQAIRWELMSRNPVNNAIVPKKESKPREIWTADTLSQAVKLCDDELFALSLNLAFSTSLRIGELLGLMWDCVDITENSIENGNASIFIDKELQRVTKRALEELNNKDVIEIFPSRSANPSTFLVLKTPKTKTSVRRVFLPKTVAEMLIKRKQEIAEIKELLGNEFTDYNLVFCTTEGNPLKGDTINRALKKLIETHNLPKVVFHSFRHSSITYKLKLTGGDIKSVQGDSGHAQVKMVTDVYSHIIDEDRRLNAQRFEKFFYSHNDTNKENISSSKESSDVESDNDLILKLLENPEMTKILKALAKSL